ncbi:MAG: 30S ribosomal protein S20 [Spirochaetales bacterium]|nr:30S ribosomal protein S20 [Spirochaetales bacterium]
MPNNKSTEKRLRQNIKRRMHNRSIKSKVRTSVKSFEVAVAKNDKVTAETCYKEFVKLADTAAGKGIYHKNTIARKKSRLNSVLAGMN